MSTECASGASPVPESGIDNVMPLLVNVSEPLTVPAVPGVKTTGTVTLCVGFSVMGVVIPTLKPAPEMVSLVMSIAVVPVFFNVTDCVVVVFSACDPKPRLVGVAVRLVELGVAGVGVGLGEVGELGELPAVFALPPHPVMFTNATVKAKTRYAYLVAESFLCIFTPHLHFSSSGGRQS